jgi:diguanylate cyclase
VISPLSDFIANILSTVFFLFSSINLYLFGKDIKTYQRYWIAALMMFVVWGFSDFVWLIMDEYTQFDPNESTILYFIYIIPNILMFYCLLDYFIRKAKRFNKTQLLVDISVMSSIVICLMAGVFFSRLNFSELGIILSLGTLIYLILDMIMVSIVLIMLSSSRTNRTTAEVRIIISGAGLYIINDFVYTYEFVTDTYLQNSYSDIIYLVSFFLISLSFFLLREKILNKTLQRTQAAPSSNHIENIGKSKAIYWLMPFPVILFFLGILPLIYLLYSLIFIIIYQFIDYTVQKGIINGILLQKEKDLTYQLEDIIRIRTHDLRKANAKLEKDSITDVLTGLYNRNYFIRVLNELINNNNTPFSVLYIDLNRFKVINDIHGHAMGDTVLKVIGERLKIAQCEDCVVARFGGDEFAVIYHNDEYLELEMVSNRINSIIREAIIIEPYQFMIDASIGISRYPKDANNVKDLMKYADIAMYHAKNRDTMDKFAIHSSHLVEKVERRNYIELLLREANYEKDFVLYYQPQFETKTKTLIGMEALLRWNHKSEGFISPAEFIPIAEEAGIILDISDWVFKTGISQIKRWNETFGKNYTLCMNLPPAVADRVDFIPSLITLIGSSNINPAWLGFEITENNAMTTAIQMEEFLTALSGMGVQVSIDDFGTGYSSLSYIKRFDVDVLKIAKELIDNIVTDHNDLLIIRAIIMMAEGMGLNTVAEGVETNEQLEILKELNCTAIQGYIYGKPIPALDFEKLYLENNENDSV